MNKMDLELEKITKEKLLEYGFYKASYSSFPTWQVKDNVYRLKHEDYHYGELQFVLGDYKQDNPNCGILCLFRPYEKVKAFPPYLYTKPEEEWNEQDRKNIDEYYIECPQEEIPFASGIWYWEHLESLLKSLINKK